MSSRAVVPGGLPCSLRPPGGFREFPPRISTLIRNRRMSVNGGLAAAADWLLLL